MIKENASSKFLHLKNCAIKRGGVTYPYYAIAESQFIRGKNQKRIIKYLGALSDEQVMSYRSLLKAINTGDVALLSLEDVKFESSKSFLDVFTLHSIWERLGFSVAFPVSDKKVVQLSAVTEILTISKLLRPSCATKTADWLGRTYLPEVLAIDAVKYNRMKIFNELEFIDSAHEKLEEILIALSQGFSPGGFKIFFIDGTTTFFEGTECDIAKPGDDKTTGFRSHVILILLVTDAKGYPVAWEVCSGNEKEIVKFQLLAERIFKKYQIKDFTFCFDRGFASLKNFGTLAGYSTKFISGLDKNQIANVFDLDVFQSTRKALVDYHENFETGNTSKTKGVVPINGFYTSNGEKFFKELGVSGKYRHIAGFSVEIFRAQQLHREKNQIRALEEICKLNEELLVAKGERDLEVVTRRVEKILESCQMTPLIQFNVVPKSVKAKKDFIQTARVEASVNVRAFSKAGELDGLFVYITDHVEKINGYFVISAYDIVNHYRNKYVIENDFKKIKNTVMLRPLHVRLEKHVRALVTTTILAQFMNVFIEQQLEDIGLSSEKFLEALSACSATAKLKGLGKTLIKHLPVPVGIEKALHHLGVTAESRAKIAATLT